MSPTKDHYDCIVLGAGPAGTAGAAFVADAGFSTLLLERSKLPREHVGESMMPESYWALEELGVLDKLSNSGFMKKVGVQFVTHDGRESQPFFFRSRHDHPSSETWHVERDEFDKMLFDNAAEKGAECHDQTRILEVLFEEGQATGVKIQTAAGETKKISSRVILDATGQQSIIANQLGLKQVNPDLKKAGIWRHYRGGERDMTGGGVKTIILHTSDKKAWFWYIPQSNDIISIGCVGDADYLLKGRGTPAEVLEEELAKCEGVVRRLGDAEPLDDLAIAKEFSYTTSQAAGDGWTLAGDAWGFIDPVYSSGVYFALESASRASKSIIEALKANDPSAERLGDWSDDFAAGTKWVRKLVHAFYSGEFRVGRFVKDYPQHSGALTDLLVGKMFSPEVPQMFDDLEPWLEKAIAEADATAVA